MIGATLPRSVQAFLLDAAQLLHEPSPVPAWGRPFTTRTRYPLLDARRLVGKPSRSSHACNESAPKCRCTTRYAAPCRREVLQPVREQVVQRGVADANRRVAVDRVEREVVGYRVGHRDRHVRDARSAPRSRLPTRARAGSRRPPTPRRRPTGSPARGRSGRTRTRDRAAGRLPVAPGLCATAPRCRRRPRHGRTPRGRSRA